MAEKSDQIPSAVPASNEAKATGASSSSKHGEQDLNIFDTCFQCRKKQVTKPTLYLLQCMHSACRDCLTCKSRDSIEYTCKCSRIVPKSHIILVNRIFSNKGQCQQSLNCKNEIQSYCNQCDLSVCGNCLNFHQGHPIIRGRPIVSCSTHPKMPAKYMCGCGKFVCHPCATGYQREHQTHTKTTALPTTKLIDSCERFNKGVCTLQNTTRVTFEMFAAERERLKQHFKLMRIELARKTMDIVNATLRKMNDCVLAMEMFEYSYLQKYEENEKEYLAKQYNMANFKKLCTSAADNNPLHEFLPYITEISSQISTDVSHFTNRIVEAIKAYSQPPEFLFEPKPIMDQLQACSKFKFQSQMITPPVRTDPSIRLIDIPIEKLAQHPLTSTSGKRKPGEKRKGGPLEDALAAKRLRDPSAPKSYEAAGTSINHKLLPAPPKNAPPQSGQSSSLSSNNLRIYSKPPSADLRNHLQNEMHRADPRMNPKIPSVTAGPRLPMHIPRIATTVTPASNTMRGGFTMTRPNMPPTMNNNMMPRMPQQGPPSRLRAMYHSNQNQHILSASQNQHIITASQQQHMNMMANNNLQQSSYIPRPPIIPKVKDGPPMMQKALMDIIRQSDINQIKATTQSSPRLNSVPDNTRVITPVSHQIPAASTPPSLPPLPPSTSVPPVGSPPINPPIKLTLRRNPPSTSMSQSPEKEEKKPTKSDDWDDYCFVCSNGCDEISGDLVCCETCPKVYHNVCHIPMINGDVKDLPDDWRCTRCKNVQPITEPSEQFTEREKMVCARVLLACYEKVRGDPAQHSEPFHNPVPRSLKRYYDVITNPICFKDISKKISTLRYQNIQQFIDDMNLVFKNACAFNRKGTPIELSCRIVFDFYSHAVKELLRPYHSKIWLYQNSPKI
jgi:hypothetical protein